LFGFTICCVKPTPFLQKWGGLKSILNKAAYCSWAGFPPVDQLFLYKLDLRPFFLPLREEDSLVWLSALSPEDEAPQMRSSQLLWCGFPWNTSSLIYTTWLFLRPAGPIPISCAAHYSHRFFGLSLWSFKCTGKYSGREGVLSIELAVITAR